MADESLEDLIKSLNDSIEDIRAHENTTKELPSNFSILVSGFSDSKEIDRLFSPAVDNLISGLFQKIENGDFAAILQDEEKIQKITETIFGKGSFQGKVSRTVINTLQATVQSRKYIEMKSNLGKTAVTLKKVNLALRNLKKNKKLFNRKSKEYKEYEDAIYAIKQVLKFAAKVYRGRKYINDRVYKGINNIVHEEAIGGNV